MRRNRHLTTTVMLMHHAMPYREPGRLRRPHGRVPSSSLATTREAIAALGVTVHKRTSRSGSKRHACEDGPRSACRTPTASQPRSTRTPRLWIRVAIALMPLRPPRRMAPRPHACRRDAAGGLGDLALAEAAPAGSLLVRAESVLPDRSGRRGSGSPHQVVILPQRCRGRRVGSLGVIPSTPQQLSAQSIVRQLRSACADLTGRSLFVRRNLKRRQRAFVACQRRFQLRALLIELL